MNKGNLGNVTHQLEHTIMLYLRPAFLFLSRWLAPRSYLLYSTRDDVTSAAVKAAVTLGMIDVIHEQDSSSHDIAIELGTDPDATSRVLMHLVGAHVLEITAKSKFRLTRPGALLSRDDPSGIRSRFHADTLYMRRRSAILDGLIHSVRTGSSSYEVVHGIPFWDDLAMSPGMTLDFDHEMQAHAIRLAGALGATYPWSAQTVVDVGGGTGALLRELLLQQPMLRGMLVEIGDATARAQALIGTAGLEARYEIVEGSFFDALPRDKDVYILSWILHDWRDDEAIKILRNCADALGDGRLLIIEKCSEEHFDTGLDLWMLVLFGARERSAKEYERLASLASLQVIRSSQLVDGFSVLECRKQSL